MKQAEQAVDSNAEDEEEEEEDDDVTDLSLWVVSIPSLHVDRKNTLFHVEVKRLVDHKEGVVWCGVVWCGVAWCGVVWCGMVWCGVVRCGAAWLVLY